VHRAHARAKQHDAVELISAHLIQRTPETDKHWVVGRCGRHRAPRVPRLHEPNRTVFNAKPFQLVFMGSERGKPFIALHGWHGLMGAMTIGNYACHFQWYAANIPIIMSAPANPNPIDQALLTALDAAFAAIAAIDSPTFTGTPALPTQSVTDNSTPAVNSAWVAAKPRPLRADRRRPDSLHVGPGGGWHRIGRQCDHPVARPSRPSLRHGGLCGWTDWSAHAAGQSHLGRGASCWRASDFAIGKRFRRACVWRD
jgi:hypothetical protein